MLRYSLGILLPILILCSGCGRDRPDDVTVVDLIRGFADAERRPSDAFQLVHHTAAGVTRASIAARAPSRLIWQLPLPRHGRFRAFAAIDPSASSAASVRVRVGVSDERIYEGLAAAVLAPQTEAWTEIDADLSEYAGWKWSVFYRPDRIRWRVILSADALGEEPATVFWGTPEILADKNSLAEYAARRRKLE